MFGLLGDLMDYYKIKRTKNPHQNTEEQSLLGEETLEGTELSAGTDLSVRPAGTPM